MVTHFIDPVNGNNSNNGTTFALRVQDPSTLTLASGDTLKYIESGAPTSLGVNGTWTDGSSIITLGSAVTKTISDCETNWTAATNVTTSSDTSTFRQGSKSQQIVIGASFTTGLAAYFPLGASTDYSSYQQITFWIKSTSTINAGYLSIKLCSDTAGATPVDTFTLGYSFPVNTWIPVTIDTGGALGASIQSVALYVNTNPGTPTINLDNLEAVTASSSADSLSLNSLIGKNTGTETWLAIRSIHDITVVLDSNPSSPTAMPGYAGTTETVTAYKRETLRPASFTNGNMQYIATAGVIVSGGWNSTDMSTQTSETWLDNQVGSGTGWNLSAAIDVDKIAVVRCNYGCNISAAVTGSIYGSNNNNNIGINISDYSSSVHLTDIKGAAANVSHGISINGTHSCINTYNVNSNIGAGIYAGNVQNYLNITGTIETNRNSQQGIYYNPYAAGPAGGILGDIVANNNGYTGCTFINNAPIHIKSLSATGNSQQGVLAQGASLSINSLTTSGNSEGFKVDTTYNVTHYLNNATMSESTKINLPRSYLNQTVFSNNEGGTVNNCVQYSDGVTVTQDTVDPHTVGGLDWKIAITSTNRSSNYPYNFLISPFAVSSGTLVTFKCWVKLSSANISAQLLIPAGYLGLTSDVTQTISYGTGTYTQYTITFTPTQQGGFPVFLQAWSSTTTDYIELADISLNQA